jgi:cytidine deaminase
MTLTPEDAKLVTLARATRARIRAAEGAAVRDLDGRTYAAATVALDSLQVSAIGVAVSMAISSGARGLEAVVLLTDGELADADRQAVTEFGNEDVPILVNPA